MTPTTAVVAAWTLAAGVFAPMLATSGTVRDVLVLVPAVIAIGLHVFAARLLGTSSWRRVPVLWSVQAGLTWLVAGEETTTSVLVYVGTGLVFALLAEVVLRMVGRSAAVDASTGEAGEVDEVGEVGDGRGRGDTAPLPVRDGEG